MEKHGYAFFGPPGVLAMSIGLPLLCYLFLFMCNDYSGCPTASTLHPTTLTLEKLKADVGWPGFAGLLNTKAALATVGYYVLSLTLNRVLPASEVQGTELQCGGRLTYRFNAFYSAVFVLSVLGAGTIAQGAEFPVWTFIHDNFVPIQTANLLVSVFLATFVYVRSFSVKPGNKDRRELAPGGHTGNMFYDWFIGRELNPRVTLPFFGEIDIKTFMELRPGLLGWVIFDLSFAVRQYREHGVVTDAMILTCFSQTLYVLDGIYMERAILTTMDVIMDGFGFMLSFGDLAWVPFIYSVQARYLASYPLTIGWAGIGGVLAVQGLGLYIFRSANNEKNRFRTDPQDPRIAHLKYLETKSGSKLLITGWWGTARHINYLGDWVMSWAYCLPTGIAGYIVKKEASATGGYVTEVLQAEARGWGMIFTYFYMLYFAILLIHRERRDEDKCRMKYGADWEKYRKLVPYRILPYVY